MIHQISSLSKEYFSGFQDLSTLSSNPRWKTIAGIIKVVSYFTLVFPLFFGAVYGISSLIGRASFFSSAKDPLLYGGTSSIVSPKGIGPRTVEEHLKEMFKSPIKTQRLFNIEGIPIGIISNPGRESFETGFFTVSDPVIVVSNQNIPSKTADWIKERLPPEWTYSILSFATINGRSPFAALGFE